MIDAERRSRIQRHLLEWYRAGHRQFPWRETRDPYRILVSEIMLQQTQADRVVPMYHEFLRAFPTLQSLADAPASEVIRAWAGLGYNRRALNLQRACREVVERLDGVIPRDVHELRSLPGIGPYTAGAVACFAYGEPVAFADVNIRRVLHRVAYGPEHGTSALKPAEVQALAEEMLPAGAEYEWNQALIELGATLCRARHVACERCPLQQDCAATPQIRAILAALPRRAGAPAERFEQTSRWARGRIVAALRHAPDDGLTFEEIGRALKPDFGAEDSAWLRGHLDGLLRDGLAVALPAGGIQEDSPPYDGESNLDAVGSERYALPS